MDFETIRELAKHHKQSFGRIPRGVDQLPELLHRAADGVPLAGRVLQQQRDPPGELPERADRRRDTRDPLLRGILAGRTGVHHEVRDPEHRGTGCLVLQRVEGAGAHRLLPGGQVDQVGAVDRDHADAGAIALLAERAGVLLLQGLRLPAGVLLGEDLDDFGADPLPALRGRVDPARHGDVRPQGWTFPGHDCFRSSRWH